MNLAGLELGGRPAPLPMRAVATGLLLLMAALYGIAHALEPRHPGFAFLRAFAEAAMVGGLADWFAVTALFRHPLGLPIPHTAIIPRNKDRIGDSLALFLRDNFLVPAVVARRMRRVDVAAAVRRFLADPPAQGRLWQGAARLLADLLVALDQERLGGMVKGALAQRLREMNIAPMLGQALAAAMRENRHLPLIDTGIRWLADTLHANETLIRAMVSERSGSIVRWFGIDETISTKIITALDKLLSDMAFDPEHPLRLKVEENLADIAERLQHDPAMHERVFQVKAAILANPAVERWWLGVWEQARTGLLRVVRQPGPTLKGQLGEALRDLGATLERDPRIARAINKFSRRAVVGIAAGYGDGIVRLVSDTVRGWDARTITTRLEQAVGRDLQYIRVNGTLVGGLVGLALHVIDWLL